MGELTKITASVYGGSRGGNNPLFTQTAYDLGKALAERNIHILWGGGNNPNTVMGELMNGALKVNGTLTACIYKKWFNPDAKFHNNVSVKVFETEDDRFQNFLSTSLHFALAGSDGTLEEIFRVNNYLVYHDKASAPLILIDPNGDFEPIIDLLKNIEISGFKSSETNKRTQRVTGISVA